MTPTVLALTLAQALWVGATPPATRTFEGLRPGQRGVCHTVFAGDEIETMAFEVRGVMRNFLGPKRDILVVRLLGDKPEFTGVVAGMSGSPCEVDGVLLGALGYAFASFAKEPIAGITPIGDMLDVLRLPPQPVPWGRPEPGSPTPGAAARWPGAAHRALYGDSFYADEARVGPQARAPSAAATLDDAGLHPLATPLSVAGVSAASLAPWASFLAERGFALQRTGGGGSAAAASPQPLVPGGAVAVAMVRGDVDVAGTGTVTWVHEGQVLAFGHPMFGAGPTSMPLANAQVINTMASAQRSFKMAVTGAPVGELTQDRLTAIAGVLGASPRVIPVRGEVRHAGRATPFAFEVARDPHLSGPMLAMALSGALEGRVASQGRGTARLRAELRVAGAPPLALHQLVAGPHDPSLLGRLGQVTGAAFDALWNPPDAATPGDASVQLTLELDDEVRHEQVAELRLDRGRAEVGDEVEAAVRLLRQDAPPATARLRFRVPASWAGEHVTVWAAGASAAQKLEFTCTGEPAPKTRAQVAALLNKLRQPDQLHLLVLRKQRSLQHDGATWSALPPSASVLWAHGRDDGTAEHAIALELTEARRGSVTGLARARLHVGPAH